ncbi:MAG TPA: methyltransferase domain-containing protein [Chitinophagaceae bacterium]|nr:methyltransferase domain-containing protein [Chitinophagaceae bacterium]
MDKEKNIIDSWQVNAASWINLIARDGIESRKLITNRAIVEAVCSAEPRHVLDIGCGEGWLVKELAGKGIAVAGVDVIPELIEQTKARVPGFFVTASYEDLAAGRVSFPGKFDTIVVNFALIGKTSTEELLHYIPSLLKEKGYLFIQTLHPYNRKAQEDYTSGWKQGSWDGLGEQFTQPYEWYFRTLEDWLELLKVSGFKKVSATDILHPHSGQHLSVIFECRVQ